MLVATQSSGSRVRVWIREYGDERERKGEHCCWWRRFFGFVRLDSVKFGRFGLREWGILVGGDVVSVLIPLLRCGRVILC